MACACVPGQNSLPRISRVFSDRTLKIGRSLPPGGYARGSKRPHSGYVNVTRSGLTHSSISWCACGRVVCTTAYGRRCCTTQTWEPRCACAPVYNTVRRLHTVLGKRRNITENDGLGSYPSLLLQLRLAVVQLDLQLRLRLCQRPVAAVQVLYLLRRHLCDKYYYIL